MTALVKAVHVPIARPGAEGAGAATYAAQIETAVTAVLGDFNVALPISVTVVRTQVSGIVVVIVGTSI